MRKSVIVTGASRGIGAQIAKDFALSGCNVLINYNNSQKEALEVQAEIKKQCENCIVEIYKCDVSSFEQCKKMADYAISIFGKIDVVVANAGISQVKPLIDVCENDIKTILGVNLEGIINICRAACENMISNKNGKIIAVSSMWGLEGASCETLYSASKAGIIGFVKALSKELGPSNINVNCVCPGLIQTQMNENLSKDELNELISKTSLERIGTPEDVSKAVLFLASENSSFITGQVLRIDGGIIC